MKVHFEASILVTDEDIQRIRDEGDGEDDLEQAVQNLIGPVGGQVLEVLGVEEALL